MTAPKRRRRTRAEKAAETRQRLLDAGVSMLLEEPIAPPINTVSANEVAYRAGLTAGALYHHWEDQEAYRDELTEYLLGPERIHESIADMIPKFAAVHHKGVLEAIRVGIAEYFKRTVEDPFWRLNVAFIASQRPEAVAHLQNQYKAGRESWAPLYEEAMLSSGLRPRAPFDVYTLSIVFSAMVEGLALRQLSGAATESLDDTSDPDAWPLVSSAVLAFLNTALESDEHAPGVSVIELALSNLEANS